MDDESGPIPVEQVAPGDKGIGRQRRDRRLKRWLRAKRPADDDVERIIGYRTESGVAWHEAHEAGADDDVLAALRREHEWAWERLRVLWPEVHAALLEGRSGPISSRPVTEGGQTALDLEGPILESRRPRSSKPTRLVDAGDDARAELDLDPAEEEPA